MLRTPISGGGKLKPARVKRCAICRETFVPRSAWAKVCGGDCAVVHAVAERKRLDAKQTRERKQALKTRNDYLKDAQAAFNAFVRERDKDLPCISCGRYHTGSYDAGHYRSVGAQPALRFNEDNVHKQCVPCNQHKSGNAVEYSIGLVARIGPERVAYLEQEHPPAKFTIEEAKGIRAHYVAALKDLRREAL